MKSFALLKQDGNARRGMLRTAHGDIQTPVFMNVATQAAIKGGLSAVDLRDIGCQTMLCNTYHLHLRPGEDVVAGQGGLHGFTGWDGPILTDSGGFQVFSLAAMRKITEEGVSFASHIDGRKITMRPEDSISIQRALGSDIIMAFDECVANPSPRDYVAQSAQRTARWLERCKSEWQKECDDSVKTMLFGINQGGIYDDLRIEHMQMIAEFDLPGYAIGGLAVGESAEEMYHILDVVTPHMPADRPRYLMGVGTLKNILEAVARGVDFFDCVLPARNARHGHLQTRNGVINLNNEKYKTDSRPIDSDCRCPVCMNYSRAYLRHLLIAKEVLGLRLCVMHNLHFYNNFMAEIRGAVENNVFDGFMADHSDIDKRV